MEKNNNHDPTSYLTINFFFLESTTHCSEEQFFCMHARQIRRNYLQRTFTHSLYACLYYAGHQTTLHMILYAIASIT